MITINTIENRGNTRVAFGAPNVPGERRLHHITIELTVISINPIAVNSPKA